MARAEQGERVRLYKCDCTVYGENDPGCVVCWKCEEPLEIVTFIPQDRGLGEGRARGLRARVEIDDAMVERAAREAFWTDDLGGHHKPGAVPHTWENIPEQGRENYRVMIRAALRAALSDSVPVERGEGKQDD